MKLGSWSTNLPDTPLAGLTRPVGVLGRELDPFTGVPSFFPDMLLCLLEVGVVPVVLVAVLRGMRLRFVESSENDTLRLNLTVRGCFVQMDILPVLSRD